MDRPIRVLVVDDSAFARKVLREVLSRSAGIEVVGIARDGIDALEKIVQLTPDVITLDLMMPGMDGLTLLQSLPPTHTPKVVVVSSTDADTQLGIAVLEAGAVEIVPKPTALATDRLYDVGEAIVRAVRAAASARPMPPLAASVVPRSEAVPSPSRNPGGMPLVLIGTSTGGPQALTRFVAQLPATFPAPIAIALHIPVGYTEALAQRLDSHSELEVVEASDGIELRTGRIVLARAGRHLKFGRTAEGLVARLDSVPRDKPHFPSVDVMFESAAEVCGRETIAVVLTGMGNDGTAGARAIHAAGGIVLTEAEHSCVIYGMPRSVVEAGLSDGVVPLDSLGAALLARL